MEDHQPDPVLLIKGIPASEIVKMLAKGSWYEGICRKYRELNEKDIVDAVRFRNFTLVPFRLAQGKTPKEIAEEFGFSRSSVWAIQHKIQRNKELQDRWGGLPIRVVTALQKSFGCTSLQHLIDNFPSGEQLLKAKGIGSITMRELGKVLPPAVRTKMDASVAKENGPVYYTKAAHLARQPYDLLLSRRTKETSEFFYALINAGNDLPENEELPSQVPCMAGPQRKWCLGVLDVLQKGNPMEIHWRCPVCGLSGVIR